MPRRSQNDDEYEQNEAPIHAPEWHAARETSRLRRRTYAGDHPEIPKVRRASRYTGTLRSPHPSSYDASNYRKESDEEGAEYAEYAREQEYSGNTRYGQERFDDEPPTLRPVGQATFSSPTLDDDFLDEDDDEEIDELDMLDEEVVEPIDTETQETQGRGRKTNTYGVLPARTRRLSESGAGYQEYQEYRDTEKRVVSRPYISHEPRLYQRRKVSYTQHSLQDRVQRMLHNRTVVVGGVVLLMLIIFLPLFSSLHNNGQTVLNLAANGNNANTVIKSANSHALTITPPNTNRPAPPVYATAAYLIDANSGAVLYAKNPFMHLPIMSTTKLMTVALAVQYGNLNQRITINNSIANDLKQQLSPDSSVMGVKKGETYTLRDLLYGMLLVSGNDAAIVVADAVSGNVPTFVVQMNKEAAVLGMNDTHYVNPDGLLANGQYSSAHDLALIAKYSLDNAQVHTISNTIEYKIPANKDHAAHDLLNGNQFLWWYPGTDAGKTGWDAGTNFVQAISCVRNGKHLIGVVIHTINWWTDMRDLMNWGFNNFVWISPRDIQMTRNIIYADEWSYFADDTRTVTIALPNGGRYYVYSGYSMNAGAIMSYFDKNKGVQKFGFPVSQPSALSGTMQAQKFEHGTIQCDTQTRQCTFKA